MAVDTLVEPSTPDVAPSEPVVTETPAESLADHEAQFSPSREREPANTGQFAEKPADARHKASSQRATPEDVAEINRLTKELREIEQRVADKDPDAKVSPRVRTLKRQIAALKALDAPATPTPAPTQPEPVPVQRRAEPVKVPDGAPKFEKPKPTIASLMAEGVADPYEALADAVYDWRHEKQQFEQGLQEQLQAQQAQQQEQQRIIATYETRVAEFAKTKPDYATVTAPLMTKWLPGLLLHALVSDDNGPAYVYHLAQHPDLADELVFDTHSKPITEAHVATVQRRLKSQLQAAHAGSAALPKAPFITPRPPNPARTGPIRTGDEPPGEDATLAEHEKHYGSKRRR